MHRVSVESLRKNQYCLQRNFKGSRAHGKRFKYRYIFNLCPKAREYSTAGCLREEHTSGTIQYTSHKHTHTQVDAHMHGSAEKERSLLLVPLSTPHSIQMGRRYADVTAFFPQCAHSLRVYQTARGATAAGIHFQLPEPIRFSLCADKSGVSLHAEANKLAYPFVARRPLSDIIWRRANTFSLSLPPRYLTGVNKIFHTYARAIAGWLEVFQYRPVQKTRTTLVRFSLSLSSTLIVYGGEREGKSVSAHKKRRVSPSTPRARCWCYTWCACSHS